jgi:hypothetical protein
MKLTSINLLEHLDQMPEPERNMRIRLASQHMIKDSAFQALVGAMCDTNTDSNTLEELKKWHADETEKYKTLIEEAKGIIP